MKPEQQILSILFNVPNTIGHIRLGLSLLSLFFHPRYPAFFVVIYFLCGVLDMVDGIAARRFNQSTKFGALYDTLADLITRTLLWTHVGYPLTATFIICWEWLCFTCAHTEATVSTSHWKSQPPDTPFVVKIVMMNRILFMYAMAGVYGLPLWLYIVQFLPSWGLSHQLWGLVAISGRVIAVAAELWYIYKHLRNLLLQDVENFCGKQSFS